MDIRPDIAFELHPQIRQHGVLVVDDSSVQRSNVVDQLRALGIGKIYEAGDGAAALSVLQRLFQAPAVVLLDLEMPGMDGIELVQRLAQEASEAHLIVASSADTSLLRAVETLVLELGLPLLGTIQKPIARGHLSAALSQFGRLAEGAREGGAGEAPEVSLKALQDALERQLIGPYYQPKVTLASGELHGMEALARWRDPDGSLIAPARFIEAAERSGLIGQVTLAMLDGVLADLKRWHAQNFFPVVAINLSAKSLSQRDFASEIMRRVDAAGVSPRSLILELTESAVVTDIASAIGALGRLRLKGFGLAIDDYGTGFSSLQQLSRLPFTELKIDRSFVRHVNEKWNLRVILESALTIGNRLGLSTVAEGVETEEELALLVAMGCTYAQGFLLARPMPAEELERWRKQEAARIRRLCVQG